MHVIMAFTKNEADCVKSAVDATLACRLNPLAVTEVPAVAHSLLTRGVHSGLIAICGCLLQALEVPVIPLEHLRKFFESDEVRLLCEHGSVENLTDTGGSRRRRGPGNTT
jgi:hypothetical protein